jgi:hypothetical protein
MPPVVTSAASITCLHGGRVGVRPGQQAVTIDGGAILCEPDLVGSPITGCTVPATPSSKPCTLVVSTLPGSSNPRVTVGGRPVMLATLQGLTDGVPPAPLVVSNPGQARVQA